MKVRSIVTVGALVLVLLSIFVTCQAYWISRLDIPYLSRSLLALGGGMALGCVASYALVQWMRGDNSLQ